MCQTCGRTFAATRGTPCYRLRTAADQVTVVLTLLSHGCPPQAIVAAFGLDERTVAAWLVRAGAHRQQVHAHLVQHGQVDCPHGQADALWVKLVGQRVWMALALAVPARLWLGGVISPQRDQGLITAPVRRGRALAHKAETLQAGMYLVGCAYNFCWAHESLRLAAPPGTGHKWQERTPAMAAGLTDHRWTMRELLSYQVPPPA